MTWIDGSIGYLLVAAAVVLAVCVLAAAAVLVVSVFLVVVDHVQLWWLRRTHRADRGAA